MFSSPTPAPSGRSVAGTALRSAGLIDRDERMRDATDKPGGRKGAQKTNHKSRTHRTRPIDALTGKDQPGPSRISMLTSRISADGALSIRGAARSTTERIRRNAISGGPLTAAFSSSVARPGARVIELWKEFINKRYNPQLRFLNLERIAEDDFIKRNKMSPPNSSSFSQRESAVVFKLASKLIPEVQTISLAHNDLVTGAALSALAHYLPHIENLSLEGNKLRGWRDIDFISGKRGKLERLRELILVGNPVRDLEYSNGRSDRYKSEIARRFPSLELLDSEPVVKIGFDVPHTSASASTSSQPTSTTFPCEMGPSFVTGVDSAFIGNFLSKFFPLFDNQRAALLDVYHPEATFSFSVNTAIPARARIEGFHHSKEMPNQRKLEWTPWISGGHGGSRNLNRMGGGVDKMVKTLHIGNENAIKAMADLPSTKHDLGAAEKFILDAWPTGSGQDARLYVSVHGQFEEEPSHGIRSFDRSFILAPAPEGSRAKQTGWDVMVLSDQLVVRAYSSHEAWRPGPLRVQAGDAPNAASRGQPSAPAISREVQAQLQSLPEPQKTLVMRICERTGLNFRFAVDCLEGNQWDFDRAVANFEQVKSTLGREAFM